MDGRQYRKLIRQHGKGLGFDRSRKYNNELAFSSRHCRVVVDYEPEAADKTDYLIYAKGVLTSGYVTRAQWQAGPKQRLIQRALDRPEKDIPTTSDDRWLHAWAPDDPGSFETEAGKWMMFVGVDKVDETWTNVAAAIRKGRLAYYGKISTVSSTPPGRAYSLCVYVPDYRDVEEALALRERLRIMGFERKIYFKRDSMTEQGKSGSEFGA